MTDMRRVNGSPPEPTCGWLMHKNCRCVRPPEHDGKCNCVYRNGDPTGELTQPKRPRWVEPQPKPDVQVPEPEPNTPDRTFLAIAITIFATVLVLVAIAIWTNATN